MTPPKTVKLEPENVFLDQWDHGVEGVDPIVKGGTDVPVSKLDEIKQLSEEGGELYRVREVEEEEEE